MNTEKIQLFGYQKDIMREIEGEPYYTGYLDGSNNKVPRNLWADWTYQSQAYNDGFKVGFEYWQSLNEIVEILT